MIAKKLKELRDKKGLSQAELASVIGVAQQTVASWEKEKSSPNYDILQNIADYFNVTTDYLFGRDVPKKKKGAKIPVLGTIVAGIPIEAIEDIIDWEEIPEAMARGGEYYALRVKGRSMEPKYLAGDTVIVRRESTIESGRVGIVLIGREDATIKKVTISPDGITLSAYNPDVYEPQFYSNKEVRELPVEIVGEVVELRRKV